MAAIDSPGTRLRATWERLSPLPGGKVLFSLFFGWMVPYTGSISPMVEELRPGYARVRMRDRRRLRNHLNSVHAVALANLAEATTGLAFAAAQPATVRAIVVSLEMTYVKKARGTLTAECHVDIPEITAEMDMAVETEVKDAAGDVVVRAKAIWRVGPRPQG